jgi:D-beta-D-heptose 7-phosphate kinase/D-beta-D-heptose 1-phosphate adenosyltransferase
VDPKLTNFFSYTGVTVFKPNRKEASEALGYSLRAEHNVREAGAELLRRLDCDNVLITLGAAGMMLFERNGNVSSVPTRAQNVADVSGAGDTAIATLASFVAAGGTVREAATLSNVAAGIVVGEPGIVAVSGQRLLHAVVEVERS